MSRSTKTFSDLNLLFTKSPVTADVTKKLDEEAIKASIRNLVSTKNFERPFHPEIGCQLYGLLFENITPSVYQTLKKTIFDVVEKFEPRVQMLDVKISETPDKNSIDVSMTFKIVNSERPVNLTTTVIRVR